MKRVMVGLLLAVGLIVPVAADEVTSNRANEAKALRSEYTKKQAEFQKKALAAKTPEDRAAALKVRPNAATYVEKAMKIVEKDAKDDAALDALVFVLQSGGTAAPPKAIELLVEHHVANPKIGPAITAMAGPANRLTPAGENLAKAVLEKSTSKDAQARACFALGMTAFQNPARAQEGQEYLERVEKEFPSIVYGKTKDGKSITLGSLAGKQLFEIRHLAVGKSAPEVTSHDLKNQVAKLSQYRGKVVVLDIWATWCGPCRAMIPHEREMVEKLKDKPFALISISADEKKETLTQFLEKESMPWVHWWEGRREGGIMNDWNIRFFPTIYVIDAKGVIRHKNIRGKQLEEAVEALIKEADSK